MERCRPTCRSLRWAARLCLAAALLVTLTAAAAAQDWKVRETRRIVWYYLEPWAVTEEQLDAVDHHVDRIAGQLRMEPGEKIRIHKYPDLAAIVRRTGVDWEAFARGEEVHTMSMDPVPHEVVHALLHRVNPDGVGILNEGLAVLVGDQRQLGRSNEQSGSRQWPLEREARDLHNEGRFAPLAGALTLRSLRGQLHGPEVWPAYVQGASFTQYLVETYGMPKVLEVYRLATPETAATVLPEVLGVPLDEIEAAWLDWLATGGLDLRRYAGYVLAAVFAYLFGRWAYRYKYVRLRTVARAASPNLSGRY